LYTSLLPNLLVQDLLSAMQSSPAVKVYVCNIATQHGETDAYTCHDHVRALEEHVGEDVFDVVLCNDNYEGQLNEDSLWVRVDEKSRADPRVQSADLTNKSFPWRHDSQKLSETLMEILAEYTGPLEQ
jgi:uncharacterized cofD-like protein